MAERFPIEGLDYVMSVIPRGGSTPATLWIGLFTSQTATTVPDADAVLATQTGVTEATGSGYARQAISAASWEAPTTVGTGRRTLGPAVTFPTVGVGGWGTINGFFLAASFDSGPAVFYANFDDGLAIVSEVNNVIKITPHWTATP